MGVKHPSDYGATLSAFGFPEFTSSFLRSLFPTFHAESVNVVEVVSTALEKIYRKSWIRLQPLGRVVGHLDIFFLTPFCIGCRRNHGNMGLAKLVRGSSRDSPQPTHGALCQTKGTFTAGIRQLPVLRTRPSRQPSSSALPS